MDDILSQGGDREPSPWPRRLALIAALIAAVVGGIVYLSLPHHQHPPAAAAPTGPPSQPPGPNGILGQTLAWDPGLRLPAAGTRPVWFSPASGRSAPIGGLPANRAGYQFTRVAGGWAVQASPVPAPGCGACAGPPAPVWFLGDGARSVTRLGAANLVAPAATAGGVWLTSYAPGVRMATAIGTAWEASAAGALTGPVVLPPGYAIDQGTVRGLLVSVVGQPAGAGVSKLWDPSASPAGQAFDDVLAASPGEIAWLSPCSPRCGVQVADLTTGRRTRVVLPAGHSVSSGAFSPDGSFLAVAVSSGSSGDDGQLAMQLEVASVATGRLALVPDTFVSSDALVGFGWPGGGDSLVAEFSFATKIQLASWRPGASSPAVAGLRPGPGRVSLILG